ncbi:MAG: hypothetical protein M3367_13790 [Acidobacteriota bacterium]|nr:hypothetical protein [Acidobacteriota bacterium]
MNINTAQIEAALSLAQNTLENQDLPAYMKKRWRRALEKAKERLIEQPFFSWQSDRLLIASVPKEKTDELGCRFYEASETECRRVDKSGLCQAFFEGFPCWHRAAFLLLGIYLGESSAMQREKNRNHVATATTVN